MKKIVIASDSFKGSLPSMEIAVQAERAIREVYPACRIEKAGIADGGEGTVEALVSGMGGEFCTVRVNDPLMRPLDARYGIVDNGKTAVIELSAAAGLPLLLPEERNPERTTTYGTGQMIADALRHGCRKILVGIGGSATNDGGMGLLTALGYRFFDEAGNILLGRGTSTGRVARIDGSACMVALRDTEIQVACDVNNPFFGERGAAQIFAPQKGADAAMVERPDAGLARFAEAIRAYNGTDIGTLPGAGAAGGAGGGMYALLGARLCPGIEMVLDALSFDRMLEGADLVITGEGRLDRQTTMGKAPGGVLARARKQNIPVVAIAGAVEAADELLAQGFAAVFPIQAAPTSLPEAMETARAAENIRRTVKQIVNLLKSFGQ